MSEKLLKIRVQLYEVSQDETYKLDDVLNHLYESDVEKRGFIGDIRMERLEKQDNLIFVDFVKRRQRGPGKLSPKQETEEFNMKPEERFGELTAILFSESRQSAIVQYNHYGPKARHIESYLSSAIKKTKPINFIPAIREDVMEAFLKGRPLSWLELGFKFSEHSPADFSRYEELPPGQLRNVIEAMSKESQDANITIKLSKVDESLKQKIADFILHDKGKKLIKSAKAKVISSEILDLLKAKEEQSYEIELDKNIRMVPFDDRIKKLKEGYSYWVDKGIIKDE